MLFIRRISLRKCYILLSVGMLGGFSIFISVIGALLNLPLSAYLVGYLIILFFMPFVIKRTFIFRLSWFRVLIWMFVFYALYSLKYSISQIASYEKSINIIYSIVIPIFIIEMVAGWYNNFSLRVLSVERSLFFLAKLFILFSFLLFIMGFVVNYEPGRYGLVGMMNPIWASRIFACLSLWVSYDYFILKRYCISSFILIMMGLFLVYKTGSNGPLLSFFVCMVVLFKDRLDFGKVVLLMISVILFIVAFICGERGADASIYSYIGRMDMVEFVSGFSLDNIWIGSGIGSFGLLYLDVDEVYYPHNILLETYMELGVIGLILLVFIILFFFIKSKLNYLTIATGFYFINSLFSGDFVGNNFLFVFLYLSSFISKKM